MYAKATPLSEIPATGNDFVFSQQDGKCFITINNQIAFYQENILN